MQNAEQKDRKSYWDTEDHNTSALIVGDIPADFYSYIQKVSKDRDTSTGELLKSAYMTCKELIFDVDEAGGYALFFVCWVLNADLKLGPQVILHGTYDPSDEETLKRDLAIAFSYEVPVVPNTQKVAPKLESLFAELFSSGFSMDLEGSTKKYAITETFQFKPDNTDIDYMGRYFQPSEISRLIKELRKQTEQNIQAKALLARITAATDELRQLLGAKERNENAIQDCLTRYPILFGVEYVKVMPKHRLGKEYETDYALQLVDGQVDVMEIEASTHSLYTKKGDPTQHLTHAEQQVMDWLAWLDANSPYAKHDLPGIRRAKGLIVIGKRSDLGEKDAESLKWRNMMYGERIKILTFDDLLDRAESLKRILVETSSVDAE